MKQGDKVICNGYRGTVVRPYGEGMVEVRVPGGVTCVSISDLNLPLALLDQAAKHSYEIETECGKITVEANTRGQAAKIATGRGFEARSVNMVG